MSVHNVNDADFEQEVMKSTTPVLVDFWGDNCGPCDMLAPVIESLAAQYSDQLKVVKINVYNNPEQATKFGIRSVPTLMLFKDGEMIQTRTGFAPIENLNKWLSENLK